MFGASIAAVAAVVATVITVLLPGVTDVGLNVAEAPVGNPETVKVTVVPPGKVPSTGAVEIANVVDPPAATLSDGVVLDTVKSTMLNVTAFEVSPAIACARAFAPRASPSSTVGLTTVTEAVPAAAMSLDGTAAVNCVALTYVVVSAVPFHCTTEAFAPFTKLVPFTVSVNAAPPTIAEAGTNEEIVGVEVGAAPEMVTETGPAVEARSLEFPANAPEIVSAPAV
jgi:hypothetical protein